MIEGHRRRLVADVPGGIVRGAVDGFVVHLDADDWPAVADERLDDRSDMLEPFAAKGVVGFVERGREGAGVVSPESHPSMMSALCRHAGGEGGADDIG